MSSPNEHLQRAESLIEYLESDLSGNPDFDTAKGARLAELHLLAANARANCYAVLPPDRQQFAAGDVITILLR